MCCPSGSANRAWTRRAPQFPRRPRASAVAVTATVTAASVVAVVASVVAVEAAAALAATVTVRRGARRLLARPGVTVGRALRAPERRLERAPHVARHVA